MKKLTNYFNKKDILFKEIKEIPNKDLGSRKKIKIYIATSIQKDYYAIFVIDSKSRFIKKNVTELIALLDALISLTGHNFKKKELLISSAICSKAKKELEDDKWSVRVDFM